MKSLPPGMAGEGCNYLEIWLLSILHLFTPSQLFLQSQNHPPSQHLMHRNLLSKQKPKKTLLQQL